MTRTFVVTEVRKTTDEFTKTFATLEEAKNYAVDNWEHLTARERKQVEAYYTAEYDYDYDDIEEDCRDPVNTYELNF